MTDKLFSNFEDSQQYVQDNPQDLISTPLPLKIVDDYQQSLGCLSLLTDREKEKILKEWTNTATDYPRNSTIDKIFTQQVDKTPEKIALIYEDQQLTYRELHQKSTQLAYYLQELGVTKETLVAIYLKRSPEVIISILAILKAGGTYLPLEISAPNNRISQILEDAEVKFIITQELSLNNLPNSSSEIQIICLDLEIEKINNFPQNNLSIIDTNGDNLAYVMYTSGSTGKPKGVCITHRGVIRLVKNTNYAILDSDQVILQAAPIAFDASTFDIWGALLNGGRLVLMPQCIPSLQELATAIKVYKITTLWLTAGLFHLMVTEKIEALKPLRQLLAGGDVLSVTDVQKVLRELPNCRFINGYGPTENTTFTCCYSPSSEKDVIGTVPIGYPIANTQVYILDSDLQPLPVGVAGELYIGGDGVARGYLNNPELTAECFISNPFSNDSSARLYKTGDRVRWRDDGVIEFLGRVDNQVKIRGFRIELGEIESVLGEYPALNNVVVLAREDRPGDKRLVAYIVAKDDQKNLNIDKIRHFLGEKLPEYMIPSIFLVLNELPLNANGKVDRRILPAPEFHLEDKLIKPRNSTESHLVDIWQEVLGFEVGINQRFTSLGGDSLQATRIISRIRDLFDVELSVSVMLGNTTITKLAELVSKKDKTENTVETIPLQPIKHDHDLPLTVYQERIWLLSQRAEKFPIHNLPMAFRLEGNLHVQVLEKTFNEIIKRHESLRTNFPLVNRLPIQRILSELYLSITTEKVDQADIETTINEEASKYFNLEKDALIRVKLLKLAENDHILIITCHHIISDGWSLSVLLKEISNIYSILVTKSSLNLPELEINYGDFTLWHRQQQKQSEIETSLLNYWENQLQDAPPLSELPCDRPRPSLQTFKGCVQTFTIEEELINHIETLRKNTNSTLFMILIAVFLILMHRYSGQDDIVIGSPIANRNYTIYENLIGCFANVLPVRSRINENPSFREFLEEIKKVSLEAYTYLDFPVEKLLSKLQHNRDLSYSPWFQVAFILLNVPNHELKLPEIHITEQSIQKGAAIFDLTVLIEHKAEKLQGSIEYNTDLYDHDTIADLIKHFQMLLKASLLNPEKSVKNLPLLIKGEEKQILQQRNQTQTDYSTNFYLGQSSENNSITIETEQTFIPSKDKWEIYLTKLWQKYLQIKSISLQDNFFTIGGDSLLAIRLFAELADNLGENIPLVLIFQAPTIEKLANILRVKGYSIPESCVIALKSQGSKPPLFFINSISYAQKLGVLMNEEQPFYCLNLFGLTTFFEKKKSPLTLENIAKKYIDDLQTIQPQGPYFLMTYCADSFLTFEIAQQLNNQGQKVEFLGFIDAIWGVNKLNFDFYYKNLQQFGLNYLFGKLKKSFLFKIEKLIKKIKKIFNNSSLFSNNYLAQEVKDIQFLEEFYQVINNYQPRFYSGKITLFISTEMKFLSNSMLTNLVEDLDIQEISGIHNDIFEKPHIEKLAKLLQIAINNDDKNKIKKSNLSN